MKFIIGLLMFCIVLGPFAAPAQAHDSMVMPVVTAAVVDSGAGSMSANHDCCPDQAAAPSDTNVVDTTQMVCDSSCDDCQHSCHASSSALLVGLTNLSVNSSKVDFPPLPTALIKRPSRSERPPLSA